MNFLGSLNVAAPSLIEAFSTDHSLLIPQSHLYHLVSYKVKIGTVDIYDK